MNSKTNPLLRIIESFFREYLTKMRGASPHTVKTYRDALRLFFVFVAGWEAELCERARALGPALAVLDFEELADGPALASVESA